LSGFRSRWTLSLCESPSDHHDLVEILGAAVGKDR
jgi:hypothetical protein